MESALLRSGARESRDESASNGWADALDNPAYVAHLEVAEPAKELASGGESDDKTLTESMAAAISERGPRALLSRRRPEHLVLIQRGRPKALAMYTAPPPTPAWNSIERAEHFIYEGEGRPASAPTQTIEEEAEAEDEQNLVQVDAVAEDEEEEQYDEEQYAPSMQVWQNPQTKRRARQAFELLNQEVLDAMPTDRLIWIMQAGFQSLMSRRIRH